MNDRSDVTNAYKSNCEEEQRKSSMGISARESGISTVPFPIVEAMFEKASNLLTSNGNVIPKPGANDGFYIVAGASNKVHCVTPGKGGCLSCDRTCVNFSTKICEHVLAIAQCRGTLNEFIAWFKLRKKHPIMMDMVEDRGPKNAGRKPSKRKRSNVKKPTVTEYVDLLRDDEASTTACTQPTTNAEKNSQRHLSTFPSHTIRSPTSCSVPLTVIPHYQPSVPSAASSYAENYSRSQTISTNHYPSMASGFNIPTTFHNYGSPTIPHSLSQFQITTSPAPSLSRVPTQNTTSLVEQPAVLPKSFFFLKWVQGKRVSKCYGCNVAIQNPPSQRPDDLVIFCHDIREYRDRISGQLQRSTTQQNVHFHFRKECIMMKYPGFSADVLKVCQEFLPYLHQEHFQQLAIIATQTCFLRQHTNLAIYLMLSFGQELNLKFRNG